MSTAPIEIYKGIDNDILVTAKQSGAVLPIATTSTVKGVVTDLSGNTAVPQKTIPITGGTVHADTDPANGVVVFEMEVADQSSLVVGGFYNLYLEIEPVGATHIPIVVESKIYVKGNWPIS